MQSSATFYRDDESLVHSLLRARSKQGDTVMATSQRLPTRADPNAHVAYRSLRLSTSLPQHARPRSQSPSYTIPIIRPRLLAGR